CSAGRRSSWAAGAAPPRSGSTPRSSPGCPDAGSSRGLRSNGPRPRDEQPVASAAGAFLRRWHVAQVGPVLERLGAGGADRLPARGKDCRPLLLAVGLLHHRVERLLVRGEGLPARPAAYQDEQGPLSTVDQLEPSAGTRLRVAGLLDPLVDF